MMDAVTLSLETWLRRCVPTAELAFDAFCPDLAPADGNSLLHAFLYDIREEERSRSGQMYVREAAGSAVSARLQPLRILQYSYRLTAHTAGWLEGQGLLGEVMLAGAATPCFPDDVVHPSFAPFGSGALSLAVAPAAPEPCPWAAVAPPSSPVLNLVVMAPLRPPADSALPPAPDQVELRAGRTDGASGPASRRPSVPRPRRRVEE
ncbi:MULTISPECIES: Pvc16 family protein [unclassified Streptomyces]|uniref:Pvc16 family protein n=1 Tax=unclassified Streptomyces TaxID=2593676 RepID=UPI00344FDC7D